MWIYNSNENKYYLISGTETKPMADTYNSYGQLVGNCDAGDYITIDTQEAADSLKEWVLEKDGEEEEFVIGEIISAYENGYKFDYLNKNFGESDVTLFQEEIECFEYHDGHNWQTITFDDVYEIVTDDTSILLNRIDEEKEYDEQKDGYVTYTHDEADEIQTSSWQGSFAELEIVLKS